MTIYTLMVNAALSLSSLSCEDISIHSYFIMEMRQKEYNQMDVQQYYDEIGLGEAFKSLIDGAYTKRVETTIMNKSVASVGYQFDVLGECGDV